MALGIPYKACGGNSATGSATLQITVTTTTVSGDCIAVWGTSNGGTPTSVADSQGNTYAQVGSLVTNGSLLGAWFVALGAKPLAAGTDTITLTCSTTVGSKTLSAFGCSGAATASATDQTPTPTTGTSTTPSITSGTLAQAAELALAGLVSANGGGAVTWGSSFTSPPASDSEHNATAQFGSAAAITVSSAGALTASGTITSAAWGIVLVTLKAAALPVPYLTQNSGMF